MGHRYKDKQLKPDTGIHRPNVNHTAVLPHDEEPGAEAAVVDTSAALSDADLLNDEVLSEAADADTPAVPPAAAPQGDEAPGTETAAAVAETPAAPPVAVLQGDEAPGTETAAAAADAPAGITAPKPKKSKWFWAFVALYVAVLMVVSCFLQVSLRQFLAKSQAEMDQQAAELAAQQAHEKALYQAPQLAFEAWQSRLTADYWTDLWYAKAPNDLDARESVQAVMAERFASDAVEAYKAEGFTNAAPVYVLKNGEETLARVTLAGSGLDWSVSEVELLIEGTHSLSVTAPSGCQVYCNGRVIGGEYAEAAESLFNHKPLESSLVGAVTWVSYRAEGLLVEPELTVESPEGYTVIQTEDGDYMLSPGWDVSAYTNRALQFVKAYLYYCMRGLANPWVNLYNALSYLTPGTQAYLDLNESYIGVYYSAAYSDIDTSKTYIEDVIVWSDNCFSVDITYNADCKWEGEHVDYADATMRIYFLKMNNGYIISNFETLET